MSQLSRLQTVDEIPYPPPPWKMNGQMWMGLFKTDTPLQLPQGLQHLLDPHSLIVVLVRYLGGTLQYDELVFGALTRLGSRMGIYVDYIWVDSLASVWGGRKIWGLPKNPADFTWNDSTVRVADRQGLIAEISVDKSPAKFPWLWMPTPGIGQLENGAWVFTIGGLWARVGRAGMQIEDWATRFDYRPKDDKPTFSFGAKPFRLYVPAAKVIGR